MVAIDATAPQTKVVKGLADVLASRNLNNARSILSSDFVAKVVPKVTEFPSDLMEEEYLQKYGEALASLLK